LGDAVLAFAKLPPESTHIAGGKGASLSRMSAAGFPVPPGFVVTASAFQQFLESSGGDELIADAVRTLDVEDASGLDSASGRITTWILSRPLPPFLAEAIRTAYADLAGDRRVAVRSSAVSEDGSAASFAGQQETFLNVSGAEDVLLRVRECWASFFSPRALFYRAEKSVLADTRMAIVVQEMIQADTSGVMFTVDPVRGRRECMVIEAAQGLGDAIVSGEITPDHYVVLREDAALVEEFIPDEVKGRVLGGATLKHLRDLGMRLEDFFGSPQDVEWCIRGRELLLLQSRPITTLGTHG